MLLNDLQKEQAKSAQLASDLETAKASIVSLGQSNSGLTKDVERLTGESASLRADVARITGERDTAKAESANSVKVATDAANAAVETRANARALEIVAAAGGPAVIGKPAEKPAATDDKNKELKGFAKVRAAFAKELKK